MKTFSVAMLAHLQGSLTKLATCILVTRRDGEVFGFTTHDRLLTIGGVDYEPAFSFIPRDVSSAHDLATDNTQVDCLLDSDSITEEDIRANRWDYAAFRLFQVNWSDLTMGDKKDRAGHLAEVQVSRLSCAAELLGLMEAFGTSVVRVTMAGCPWNLGSRECKVDLAPFTVTGTIGSADPDLYTIVDGSRAEADGYFDDGTIEIEWAEGTLQYEVKTFAGGQFITKTPLAGDATGVAYTAIAGCDKKRTTCRDTFANIENFGGQPFLRGQDAMIQVGRRQ